MTPYTNVYPHLIRKILNLSHCLVSPLEYRCNPGQWPTGLCSLFDHAISVRIVDKSTQCAYSAVPNLVQCLHICHYKKLIPESQCDLVPSTPYNLNRKSYEIIVGFTQKILSVQFFLAEKIDPPSLNYLVQLLAEITISLASQPTF